MQIDSSGCPALDFLRGGNEKIKGHILSAAPPLMTFRVRSGSVQVPFGFRSGSFGFRSGCVRGLYGIPVRGLFGVRTGSIRAPYGVHIRIRTGSVRDRTGSVAGPFGLHSGSI